MKRAKKKNEMRIIALTHILTDFLVLLKWNCSATHTQIHECQKSKSAKAKCFAKQKTVRTKRIKNIYETMKDEDDKRDFYLPHLLYETGFSYLPLLYAVCLVAAYCLCVTAF